MLLEGRQVYVDRCSWSVERQTNVRSYTTHASVPQYDCTPPQSRHLLAERSSCHQLDSDQHTHELHTHTDDTPGVHL